MTLILYIFSVGLFVLLVLFASIQPKHSELSFFELKRRQKMRNKKAEETLGREELLAKICPLRLPLLSLILITLTALLIFLIGWTFGVLTMLLVGIFYSRVARSSLVRRLSDKLYERNEGKLLKFISRHENKLRLISGKRSLGNKAITLGSREELAHLLEGTHIFSEEDKTLLRSAIRFKERTVDEIMTPSSDIVSVKDSELLGPLVLDDLHKTGHTIFPVTKGERIVGLLDSSDHVVIRSMESVHVRSVMQGGITRIDQGVSLDEALRTFIDVKQPLLVVVDGDNNEIGIISFGDIIRSLTGWKQR